MPDHTKANDEKRDDASVDPGEQAGEDNGSTSVEGKDDHLHEDQKPTSK